jgi:hypothetical protein
VSYRLTCVLNGPSAEGRLSHHFFKTGQLIPSCLVGSAALLFFIHEMDEAEGTNGWPPAASLPIDRHLPLRTSL